MKEIFLESLLHRKIFRRNFVLGYMHASIALGWLLLIIAGNLETKLHSSKFFNMPYDPVFLKFFVHERSGIPIAAFYTFVMDFLLLIILIGIGLAVFKRFRSMLFGLKRTTRLKSFDKIARYSIWLIFPLRFLAESFTSGQYNTGGFLTGTAGHFFAAVLPVDYLSYPVWWGYSIMLCMFFIALPFSRYMHIPTEVALIMLRNFGIKTNKIYDGITEFEVNSCPRCGICIDVCQLNEVQASDIQAVYFIQSSRENKKDERKAFNCLLCGRCENVCPVGIEVNAIRITKRKQLVFDNKNAFNFLTNGSTEKADVIYYAGCMTHLTPAVKSSMCRILDEANVNYLFLDKDGSVCCGRPLLMAGKIEAALSLVEKNKKKILESGAKTLVTSCPICYKIFREEYKLPIEALHHSQYILRLVREKKITLSNSQQCVVYHDPCELGRGCGIYDEPREILSRTSQLVPMKNEKNNSWCCGGSLGDFKLSAEQKSEITRDVLMEFMAYSPEIIATACPLCKKTFAKYGNAKIQDIAEIVLASILKEKVTEKKVEVLQ
ncbi:MAG: (Fe-S)-binding protein [Bacteroidia bacterium]|nr:(Fe-S)-binding protein [Bacteroidia bacterium]